jgi:hypothetical protein
MSESIQQAITAARSLSPEVRTIIEVDGDAEGQTHLARINESVQALIARYRMTPAFWLALATADSISAPLAEARHQPAPVVEAKPAPALVAPEKNEKPKKHYRTPPAVTDEWREAARLLSRLNTVAVADARGRVTALGNHRIGEMVRERGFQVADTTIIYLARLEKSPRNLAPETITAARDGFRALLAELSVKPDPEPTKGEGPEWVSNFEPIESTKPEREKASDDVRVLQALAAGTMWPNVIAARFGWSETYMTQVMNRLSGQGRAKRDERGRYYITHLGRKATLEAAA